MAQPKKFDLKGKIKPALKIAGLAIVAIIVVYIAFSFIGSFISGLSRSGYQTSDYYPSESLSTSGLKSISNSAPLMDMEIGSQAPSLSTRNAASWNISGGYGGAMPAGGDAEEFEATEYRAQIEARQVSKTCAAVSGLKSRDDVVFINASESEKKCSYSFKVKRASANAILTVIKGLNPKQITNSTYTIQQQVNDYTSQVDILQKKLASVDDTLEKAVAAYDEVTELATNVKDAESLAKVIDSKINTIEQLTQQRLNINNQLDQIQRSKDQQLDRLDYTYFYVNVTDNNFIDTKQIKDSWNAAVKNCIFNINETIQNISINLIAALFTILQFIVYGLIFLVVAKFCWVVTKKIWQK
jgi:hypothetical protein